MKEEFLCSLLWLLLNWWNILRLFSYCAVWGTSNLSSMLYLLICDNKSDIWASAIRSDLESVLIVMFDNIFHLKVSEPGSSSHQDIREIFLNVATFSRDDKRSAENCMSFEEFRNWCTLIPSARKFLGSLLMPPDPGFPPFFIHLCPFNCCPI